MTVLTSWSVLKVTWGCVPRLQGWAGFGEARGPSQPSILALNRDIGPPLSTPDRMLLPGHLSLASLAPNSSSPSKHLLLSTDSPSSPTSWSTCPPHIPPPSPAQLAPGLSELGWDCVSGDWLRTLLASGHEAAQGPPGKMGAGWSWGGARGGNG